MFSVYFGMRGSGSWRAVLGGTARDPEKKAGAAAI
jgi:hypothetical protein